MEASDRSGVSVHLSAEGGWSVPKKLLETGVRRAAARGGIGEGEISLTFLGDGEIRALNRHYLGRDEITDVIAFSLCDPGSAIVGDIYVGYDQARRQADELGIALTEELLRLAIHGTLHVTGQDHPAGEDRFDSEMFRLQEEIVRETLPPGSTPA
jgi:probable rRNA maturation factor